MKSSWLPEGDICVDGIDIANFSAWFEPVYKSRTPSDSLDSSLKDYTP